VPAMSRPLPATVDSVEADPTTTTTAGVVDNSLAVGVEPATGTRSVHDASQQVAHEPPATRRSPRGVHPVREIVLRPSVSPSDSWRSRAPPECCSECSAAAHRVTASQIRQCQVVCPPP
jgi:hypothetical protein